MKSVSVNDMRYFLKQKVLDKIMFFGVIEDSGNSLKVCSMKNSEDMTVKIGEVAIIDKQKVTNNCINGNCEIISLESFLIGILPR